MASCVSYKEQFIYVSNQRFGTLIELALEVGQKTAESDTDRAFVACLREKNESFFPGFDFAMETEFPSLEERKFWARVFYDLSYKIFRREIGNQDVSFWQYSAIGDAYLIGRILTKSVQEQELAWHPRTLATLESEIFYSGGVNVRL